MKPVISRSPVAPLLVVLLFVGVAACRTATQVAAPPPPPPPPPPMNLSEAPVQKKKVSVAANADVDKKDLIIQVSNGEEVEWELDPLSSDDLDLDFAGTPFTPEPCSPESTKCKKITVPSLKTDGCSAYKYDIIIKEHGSGNQKAKNDPVIIWR